RPGPPAIARRRIDRITSDVKKELSSLLNITSISVYRLRHDEDLEIRDRFGRISTTPIDYRLKSTLADLSQYCSEISQKENKVAQQLQKDVLTSILSNNIKEGDMNINISDFNAKDEETKLVQVYEQLGILDNDVSTKIKEHVKYIENIINEFPQKNEEAINNRLTLLSITTRVVDLSLQAYDKNKIIRKQLELFLGKLKEFMPEKNFSIVSGKLT